jgi:hypothetical protein
MMAAHRKVAGLGEATRKTMTTRSATANPCIAVVGLAGLEMSLATLMR